jgi:hypothetical protein
VKSHLESPFWRIAIARHDQPVPHCFETVVAVAWTVDAVAVTDEVLVVLTVHNVHD